MKRFRGVPPPARPEGSGYTTPEAGGGAAADEEEDDEDVAGGGGGGIAARARNRVDSSTAASETGTA